MPLYPQSFIDEVRAQADIVAVVQDTVSLKRAGATYKGLCPFHGEKTPSFHVNRDRGFFHCFGCGVGGDVFKFVELRDKIGFGEAVRHLAQRFGIPVPEAREGGEPGQDAEREALLKAHEVAAAWFGEQLAGAAGRKARAQLDARDVTAATIKALGLGYAPAARDALARRLERQGFALPILVKSGLVVRRDDGQIVDRFRNRLMIPIHRESGLVVAFGGRALEPDQQPKYLNSPETPIYVKSKTLYGLHLSKGAIRKAGSAVLVEGYFDFAQAWQAGVETVVASCGTALAAAQAQLLRRFTSKVVLSFDPDSAGQGAAERSSELLVSEGFQVNVAVLPQGEDPDTFVRHRGGAAYAEEIARARPYLDYLLERSAAQFDVSKPEGRREFVLRMLGVASRIPEATARDQFADQLAHRARISEDVVRQEIRRAAVARKTTLSTPATPGGFALKPAEQHLLAALINAPEEALRALAELEADDLEGLASGEILRAAQGLGSAQVELVPSLLLERLNEREASRLTALAAKSEAGAAPAECARALRRLRYERERAEVQRELDRLQEQGAPGHEIDALLQRKGDLLVRLESLNT